jgi:hypothetical protein
MAVGADSILETAARYMVPETRMPPTLEIMCFIVTYEFVIGLDDSNLLRNA